jgi:DNA-binding response OmpR family regulator
MLEFLTRMKLLVIEDEKKTSALLQDVLQREGYDVECMYDGISGRDCAINGEWEALIVDIMLPKMSGLDVVAELRAAGIKTPVIMLSARGEVEQRIEGLDSGADDYLAKPFSTSELTARLRALLRRGAAPLKAKIKMDDLVYDPATREARRAGQRIDLSQRESLLLDCLLSANGNVVSRRDIITCVWEYDFDPGTNLVEVYIRRLREKIDRDHAVSLIHNVRGMGYRMQILP